MEKEYGAKTIVQLFEEIEKFVPVPDRPTDKDFFNAN